MTRSRENADGARLDAPLASPAFTGTPTGIVTGSIADDAVTLDKMASGTDGNIISYDASGNPVAIVTGDDGQVLTSTGAGSPPAFEAVSAPAGSGAFMARFSSDGWLTPADGAVLTFDNASSGDSFDTDSNFSTTTSKYTIPANGVYYFYYGIFTANSDLSNAFGFSNQSGEVDNQGDTGNFFSITSGSAIDHIQVASMILPFSSGNTVWVSARTQSDVYKYHSYWGGCRLK